MSDTEIVKHYLYVSPYQRSHSGTQLVQPTQPKRVNGMFTKMLMRVQPPPPPSSISNNNHSLQSSPSSTPPPPPRWGAIYWRFFHVMAARLKSNEVFLQVRDILIDMIRGICTNLPCPICRQHAVTYLQNTNWSLIRSKEDLQWFFYYFHNQVNANKRLPLFAMEDVLPTYNTAYFPEAFRIFVYEFSRPSHNSHQITTDMARKRIGLRFKLWIENNLSNVWDLT